LIDGTTVARLGRISASKSSFSHGFTLDVFEEVIDLKILLASSMAAESAPFKGL
jgi:hypothetical protein